MSRIERAPQWLAICDCGNEYGDFESEYSAKQFIRDYPTCSSCEGHS